MKKLKHRKKIDQLNFIYINNVKWYIKYFFVRYWRNNDSVRKWMVNKNKISFLEHFRWLKKIEKQIEKGECSISIVFLNGNPIGVCGVKNINYKLWKEPIY